MKSILVLVVAVALTAGLMLAGCQEQQGGSTQQVQISESVKQAVQQQAATAVEAVKNSEAMKTVQEKVNYLVGQANNFYNDKKFQQVVDVAQHILSNLDANSSPAKNLLEKAKQQLQAAAQTAVGDVGKQLETLGK